MCDSLRGWARIERRLASCGVGRSDGAEGLKKVASNFSSCLWIPGEVIANFSTLNKFFQASALRLPKRHKENAPLQAKGAQKMRIKLQLVMVLV